MPEVKIVGRGVDTLVLNVCYANEHFQPVKQELAKGVQHELEVLQGAARRREAAIPTRWSFKGRSLFMQEKGFGFRALYDDKGRRVWVCRG
jgi:hypothetical protein